MPIICCKKLKQQHIYKKTKSVLNIESAFNDAEKVAKEASDNILQHFDQEYLV